jgi:hypothetical protein
VGYAVYIESTVPEIQDFPGLRQELDNLKQSLYPEQALTDVDFNGNPGNKITITGGVVVKYADKTSHCKLITDSARMYISKKYQLTVEILRPGDLNWPFPMAEKCT